MILNHISFYLHLADLSGVVRYPEVENAIPVTIHAPVIKLHLVLDDQFINLLPKTFGEFDKDVKKESANGMVQAALLEFGKGKVFVAGEAGMFSAQIAGGSDKIGFNNPKAKHNAQLLLNIMYWLSNK